MNIKEISIKDYKKMCDKMESCRRIESPAIDPIMKTMTVIGQSGKGTPFENEYERMLEKWRNPPRPSFIDWHHENGITRFMPKKER